MLRALGPPRRTPPIAAERFDEARIIRMVLIDLPADVRDSAAGSYALARSFYHDGQDGAARVALAQVMQQSDSLVWQSAANALLEQLTPQATTSQAVIGA